MKHNRKTTENRTVKLRTGCMKHKIYKCLTILKKEIREDSKIKSEIKEAL